MIHVWLALDPDTLRVTMQDREFSDGDFPRGLRGVDWPQREGEIPEETYAAILSGDLPGKEVDAIHRTLWTKGGETAWPNS